MNQSVNQSLNQTNQTGLIVGGNQTQIPRLNYNFIDSTLKRALHLNIKGALNSWVHGVGMHMTVKLFDMRNPTGTEVNVAGVIFGLVLPFLVIFMAYSLPEDRGKLINTLVKWVMTFTMPVIMVCYILFKVLGG